jgi:hypothetical protein
MSKSDNTHERKTARWEATQMALAAPTAVLLIPLIFWLQYGVINGIAWGLAAFLAAICLLTAVGIYFKPRSEYHSPVPLHGGIGDAIGSFWLVSCVLGILVSWFVSERTIFPEDSWKSIYRDWVLFSIVLPLVTAVLNAAFVGEKIIGVKIVCRHGYSLNLFACLRVCEFACGVGLGTHGITSCVRRWSFVVGLFCSSLVIRLFRSSLIIFV